MGMGQQPTWAYSHWQLWQLKEVALRDSAGAAVRRGLPCQGATGLELEAPQILCSYPAPGKFSFILGNPVKHQGSEVTQVLCLVT